MAKIFEAVCTMDHLLARDTADRTIAFVDAELYFSDGSVRESSTPIVVSPSEFTAPVLASSNSIGDVLRAGLFDQYEDLKDYRIVETVFPSAGREFKRRIKDRRKEIAGERLYRSVMTALVYNSDQIGSLSDIEL